MAKDELLGLDEIAARLKMPLNTARYKRHRGELPFTFRIGRRVVGFESDLEAWLESQRAAQTPG